MEKYAVIDLGSNTFHLLIAQLGADRQFNNIYRNRVYSGLARTGIGTITEASFEDGLAILRGFKEEIDKYEVKRVKVVGTEMLRLAPNGHEFVQKVFEQTGLAIEIISGQQEAEYIYLGVKQLFPDSSYVIMDIGGGSVEFIQVRDGEPVQMESLPIGVAVLYLRFHLNDPISDQERQELEAFLQGHTRFLAQATKDEPLEELIGSSGVFETFFDLMEVPFDTVLDAEMVVNRLDHLIKTSLDERLKMDTIPKPRKKMIIVASILLKFVLELTSVKRIRYSANSLKEGLLYAMIQEKEL